MRSGIVLLCFASVLRGGETSSAQIRNAATRALTLLQASQKTWYSKINCHSCHHQFLPALAFRAAREHGVPVDEAIARADAAKAFAYSDLDAAVQFRDVVETTMDLAYALVAANATGLRPNLALQVYARAIAGRQDPEGNWDDIHQRPPQSYSRFTQTSLGLRAIELYSHPNQGPEITVRVARAKTWLLSRYAARYGGAYVAADWALVGWIAAGSSNATGSRAAGAAAIRRGMEFTRRTGERRLFNGRGSGGAARFGWGFGGGQGMAARDRLSGPDADAGRVLARGVASSSPCAGESRLF